MGFSVSVEEERASLQRRDGRQIGVDRDCDEREVKAEFPSSWDTLNSVSVCVCVCGR